MNKYIVYLGNTGCEAILEVTFYQDLYLEYRLLANPDDRESSKFEALNKLIRDVNSMDLRCRFNSHREIEAFVWETEYSEEELWDALEKNGDYHHLVKTTAKPYLNTQKDK